MSATYRRRPPPTAARSCERGNHRKRDDRQWAEEEGRYSSHRHRHQRSPARTNSMRRPRWEQQQQQNQNEYSPYPFHRDRDRSRNRHSRNQPSAMNHRSSSTQTYSPESPPEESEEERKLRWHREWLRTKHLHPARPSMPRLPPHVRTRQVLQIKYWERTPINLDRKQTHMEMLDACVRMSREEWILATTLRGRHVELEPNIFPYETPRDVSHYTLWSRTYLEDFEVESFVENWLDMHRPHCQAWGWDPSNLLEGLSVDLFHVHVFLYEGGQAGVGVRQEAVILNQTCSHKAQLPLLD